MIERAVRLALAELSPARLDASPRSVERELAKVRAECERLADAIARGGPIDVLLEQLQARRARVAALEGQLVPMRPIARLDGPQGLRAKLPDWRGLLQRNVAEGRAVLGRPTPVHAGARGAMSRLCV